MARSDDGKYLLGYEFPEKPEQEGVPTVYAPDPKETNCDNLGLSDPLLEDPDRWDDALAGFGSRVRSIDDACERGLPDDDLVVPDEGSGPLY